MMDRRSFVKVGALGLAACAWPRRNAPLPLNRPVPSPSQLDWQRDELAMFLHFGVNTFTDREWGDGKESPSIFNPAALDARQWARTAKQAGFKAMVLTAKHHDGFCLWPTRTTTHSVASSPFRGGRGDVVREFVDACRAEGLRAGLYLSPWDRNHPTYGDSPRYNDVYIAQLTELLSRYGEIAEVWFDGANGEGPNGKRQVYDWPRVWGTVRALQPKAVIFSDAGPDVRWCGNERGLAGDPNWSTVNPARVPFPGADGPGIIDALQHGDRDGTVWRPAEVDVSIRPGWFYHPAEDARVRSVENLVELYFSSVGRNGKLLLNVPPTPQGLIHATDADRLKAMRAKLDDLFVPLLPAGEAPERSPELEYALSGGSGSRNPWMKSTGPRSAEQYMDLSRSHEPTLISLSENIARGQVVAQYRVEGAGEDGAWKVLCRGTTIGYRKLHRIDKTRVRRIQLIIEDAVATPEWVSLRIY